MNRCVCCGKAITEGRQVCPTCERNHNKLINNVRKEAVEEFAEKLEVQCFDEIFYMDLHDAIEKVLKEYK